MPDVTDRRSFLLGKGDGTQVTFTGTLPGVPIRPGTLTAMWKARGQPRATALDNGTGGWLDHRGGIHYTTGALTLTWDRPPVKGVSVVVEYRTGEATDGPVPDLSVDLSKPAPKLKMQVRYPSPGEPEWLDSVSGQASVEVACPVCKAPAETFCSPGASAESTHVARLHAWSERPARDKIVALRAKHGLSFTQNPGGGEFGHPVHGRCQVPLHGEGEDYGILLRWLRECGLEAPDTLSVPPV